MGAAERLSQLDQPGRTRDVDGGDPPRDSRRRLARLLWKLYEHWEREQECAISEASE